MKGGMALRQYRWSYCSSQQLAHMRDACYDPLQRNQQDGNYSPRDLFTALHVFIAYSAVASDRTPLPCMQRLSCGPGYLHRVQYLFNTLTPLQRRVQTRHSMKPYCTQHTASSTIASVLNLICWYPVLRTKVLLFLCTAKSTSSAL